MVHPMELPRIMGFGHRMIFYLMWTASTMTDLLINGPNGLDVEAGLCQPQETHRLNRSSRHSHRDHRHQCIYVSRNFTSASGHMVFTCCRFNLYYVSLVRSPSQIRISRMCVNYTLGLLAGKIIHIIILQ